MGMSKDERKKAAQRTATANDIARSEVERKRREAKSEAYWNEPVELLIHPADKIEENFDVFAGVNGHQVLIKRGIPVIVARKIAEAIKNAKVDSFLLEPNPENGGLTWRSVPIAYQRFPFQIREMSEVIANRVDMDHATRLEAVREQMERFKKLEAELEKQIVEEGQDLETAEEIEEDKAHASR